MLGHFWPIYVTLAVGCITCILVLYLQWRVAYRDMDITVAGKYALCVLYSYAALFVCLFMLMLGSRLW